MPDSLSLNPDGLHTPENTRLAAEHLSEVMRYLAYATRMDSGGLAHPADVDAVVAELETALGHLPQVTGNLMRALGAMAPWMEVRHGLHEGQPGMAFLAATARLADTEPIAQLLTDRMHKARQVIATIGTRDRQDSTGGGDGDG